MKSHIRRAISERLVPLRLEGNVLVSPQGNIPVRKIGEGMFARAYRVEPDGDVLSFVDKGIYDKDLAEAAMIARPDNPHLPIVEKIGVTEEAHVYRMPFYKTPLKPEDGVPWEDHRKLVRCRVDVRNSFDVNQRSDHKTNRDIITCARALGVTPAVVDALEELAVQAASNKKTKGTCAYEFQPRNMGTDAKGNLVLLDVLYDSAEAGRRLAAEEREAKARKRRRAR